MTPLAPWQRLLMALLSGVALSFAFAPYRLGWPLAWISLAMLMRAALGARFSIAVLCGILHGLAFYGLTVPWFYTTMRVHGGVEPLAAASVLALMVIALAMFPAAFAAGTVLLGARSTGLACVAAPFLWVALEFARRHLPIVAFPWNLLGYAMTDQLGFIQMASVTGVYGLSFFVLAGNATFLWSQVTRTTRARTMQFLTLLLVLGLTLVSPLVPKAKARYVARLVQANFPMEPVYKQDWLAEHTADLDELERLSANPAQKRPSLIVWPEVPAPFTMQDPRFAARAEHIARSAQSHLLVGVVEWHPNAQGKLAPHNSAALVGPDGEHPFVYDKIHLVAFGEFVPFRRVLRFVEKVTAQIGDFEPGTEYKVGRLPGGTFSVLICYEAAFPDEVRRFVGNGAELLVNMSNDGWFGRSAGPDQHLAMTRLRAVENRRWLVRTTNNGHTVAVDPYGRIVARLGTDVRAVLDVPYDFRTDRTIYARFGDWVAWLCVIATGAVFVVHFLKRVEARG